MTIVSQLDEVMSYCWSELRADQSQHSWTLLSPQRQSPWLQKLPHLHTRSMVLPHNISHCQPLALSPEQPHVVTVWCVMIQTYPQDTCMPLAKLYASSTIKMLALLKTLKELLPL